MGRLSLVIIDPDTRYTDSLAAYVLGHSRLGLSVQTFSDVALYAASLDGGAARADILLVSEGLLDECAAGRLGGFVVALSAGGGQNTRRPGVSRYGGADELLSGLLRLYSDYDGAAPDAAIASGGRLARATLVYSPCGGAGRTTVALGLCAHMARMGRRALYLSLDWGGAAGCAQPQTCACAQPQAGGMSEIVFAVKARPDKLVVKLAALQRMDAIGRFYYYPPPDYPADIDELDADEAALLLAKLSAAGLYDEIVVDAHSGLSIKNMRLLECADTALIVVREGPGAAQALARAADEVARAFGGQAEMIIEKCRPVLNAAAGGGCGLPEPPDGAGEHAQAFYRRMASLPMCEAIVGRHAPDAIANAPDGLGPALAMLAAGLAGGAS